MPLNYVKVLPQQYGCPFFLLQDVVGRNSMSKQNKQSIFFRQITTFIKVGVAFVFGLHTFLLTDFTKICQLNGLQPKFEGHMNFYECCDLTVSVVVFPMVRSKFCGRILMSRVIPNSVIPPTLCLSGFGKHFGIVSSFATKSVMPIMMSSWANASALGMSVKRNFFVGIKTTGSRRAKYQKKK